MATCELCGYGDDSKSDHAIKIHKGKAHKVEKEETSVVDDFIADLKPSKKISGHISSVASQNLFLILAIVLSFVIISGVRKTLPDGKPLTEDEENALAIMPSNAAIMFFFVPLLIGTNDIATQATNKFLGHAEIVQCGAMWWDYSQTLLRIQRSHKKDSGDDGLMAH